MAQGAGKFPSLTGPKIPDPLNLLAIVQKPDSLPTHAMLFPVKLASLRVSVLSK